MRGHGGCAIALGGMMPASQERYPTFASVMGLRLRDLAGDESVGAGRDRGLEVALGSAGAPCDLADRARIPCRDDDGSAQRSLDVRGQALRAGEAGRVGAHTQEGDILFTETR